MIYRENYKVSADLEDRGKPQTLSNTTATGSSSFLPVRDGLPQVSQVPFCLHAQNKRSVDRLR